jgi:hypothetical protein
MKQRPFNLTQRTLTDRYILAKNRVWVIIAQAIYTFLSTQKKFDIINKLTQQKRE